MILLELYIKGERDYALITGPTGPIVYVVAPARLVVDCIDCAAGTLRDISMFTVLYMI